MNKQKGKVSGITTWRIDPSSKELKIQYSSSKYTSYDDGVTLGWNNRTWKKLRNLETKGIANLKLDSNAFIDGLVGHSWSDNATKVGTVEFTRTFSNTEGVVVKFDEKEALKALANWGVASGALITPSYRRLLRGSVGTGGGLITPMIFGETFGGFWGGQIVRPTEF